MCWSLCVSNVYRGVLDLLACVLFLWGAPTRSRQDNLERLQSGSPPDVCYSHTALDRTRSWPAKPQPCIPSLSHDQPLNFLHDTTDHSPTSRHDTLPQPLPHNVVSHTPCCHVRSACVEISVVISTILRCVDVSWARGAQPEKRGLPVQSVDNQARQEKAKIARSYVSPLRSMSSLCWLWFLCLLLLVTSTRSAVRARHVPGDTTRALTARTGKRGTPSTLLSFARLHALHGWVGQLASVKRRTHTLHTVSLLSHSAPQRQTRKLVVQDGIVSFSMPPCTCSTPEPAYPLRLQTQRQDGHRAA